MIKHQCVTVKYYFLLGIHSAGTFVMLNKAYKNDAMVKTQVCKWFFCFKSNETMIDDKLLEYLTMDYYVEFKNVSVIS